MATTVAIPPAKAIGVGKQVVSLIPGLLLLAVVGYAGKFIEHLSRWAFLLTFAGVGLRTSLRDLGKQGWRPFAVGAIGEVFIAW